MRSTFWAGAMGVCLACGLSVLGCGDDEAAAPGGSAGSAGGEGAGEASCSGLDTSAVVDELTPAEVEQACKGYRRCSAESVTVESICRMMGVLGARFGDEPGTDDATLRARCAEQYESCMADPSQTEQLKEQAIAELDAKPCPEPTDCTATVAELDACAAALREYGRQAMPECSALTVEFYEADRSDDALEGACGKLSPGCLALVAEPKDG